MSLSWFERAVEVVCNNETAHAPGVHVAWLFPDAPAGVNVDALLVGDDPVPTLAAAVLRERAGEAVRAKFRFVCPTCGERGATPEARAEVLRPILERAAALGVPRVDIYSLERYCSG